MCGLDAVAHGMALCFELMERMDTNQEVVVDWSVIDYMWDASVWDRELGEAVHNNCQPWKRKITSFDDIADFVEELKKVADFITEQCLECRAFFFEGFSIDDQSEGPCTITLNWGS